MGWPEVNLAVMVHRRNSMISKCGHLQNFAPGERSNSQPLDFVAAPEEQQTIELSAFRPADSTADVIRS